MIWPLSVSCVALIYMSTDKFPLVLLIFYAETKILHSYPVILMNLASVEKHSFNDSKLPLFCSECQHELNGLPGA